MKLTTIQVKNAKANGKTQRLTDGRGMYLEISPTGRKWWRAKYRYDGKEKRLALGVFPETTLQEAREKLNAARKLLRNDVDPIENRRAAKMSRSQNAADTFAVLAREWHGKHIDGWTEKHGRDILLRLEQNLFPWLGDKPVTKVIPQDLLKILNKVQERGALETAHRLLQYCSKIFRYAVVTGRLDRDLTVGLKEALKPVQKSHLASITNPEQVGELLRAIDGYQGNIITKIALQFAPLVFVRPGELRQAEWSEIDLENAQWDIPAEKMKMGQPHVVPLSHQAVDVLKEIHPVTGHCKYVFPSLRTRVRPMSNNTILAALRRMGYAKEEMCGHGFRAMARTILDEVLDVRVEIIEQQLAHVVKDANGRAYNRTKHLPQRREMMQRWADYLDSLKVKSGKLINMKDHVA